MDRKILRVACIEFSTERNLVAFRSSDINALQEKIILANKILCSFELLTILLLVNQNLWTIVTRAGVLRDIKFINNWDQQEGGGGAEGRLSD